VPDQKTLGRHPLPAGKTATSMAVCPICKLTAEEIVPGFFDGTTYRSQKDGEFDVSDSVLQTRAYMKASTAEWEAALKRAKDNGAPGKRPRIRAHHFQFLDAPPQSE
jgi:hypothetical protein